MVELLKENQRKENIKEPIYKNGCWDCKRASEDPNEEYTCPKLEQHWQEYKKLEYES